MNIPVILKELAKGGVIALTEESVKAFVETKIKPIFANWGTDESRAIELEDCLNKYLLRCYKKNNLMTTIVFDKQQKTLEDLYIPLTLEEYGNKYKKWIVNEKCYDILDKYPRLLIVDMAGMGKSTIVKYFACQGINLNKSIPIVIELKGLKKHQAILEYIQKQINSLDNNIKIEEIVDILEKGDFVIFFDGYDEIANRNKSNVLDAIQEFTDKANKTKIVITSRKEDDLNALGEFKCVNIKPLTSDEAYELIRKYDNNGEISKKLIKKLEEDLSIDILREFLENPLLVSLLYKTFDYKEEIPYKKIDFYEQVYESFFNDHDKTKGSAYVHEKKTKLDMFQFAQILRAFSFLSLKTDKVEYSLQIIHQLLRQSMVCCDMLNISAGDFLYDLTHAVPFILKEGNKFRWIHGSFRDYFASCFMFYDNKEFPQSFFDKVISNKFGFKYYDILDFYYDMDVAGVNKYVILPYLKEYINRYDNSFQNSYFKYFNKKDINSAKYIIALLEEVKFECFDLSLKETKKLLNTSKIEDVGRPGDYTVQIQILDNLIYIYAYRVKDLLVYELIKKKIPTIFDNMTIKKKSKSVIQNNKILRFDDDIKNAINKNNEIFSEIVNVTKIILQREKVIDYTQCKKVMEEIETEIDFLKNDIFDFQPIPFYYEKR